MENNRRWIKLINSKKTDDSSKNYGNKGIEIYPIQFANCERLMGNGEEYKGNDAVYIFDEVGSGKTISSGIMALDYLEQNTEDKVLVVTINSLVRRSFDYPEGVFKKEWLDKLPFNIMELDKKIEVVNNHYTSFKYKNTNFRYGLVIIDEAQLFLNKESKRYKELISNVRAKKIVFLTATPIKNNVDDLYTYIEIGENILGKKLSKEWVDQIKTTHKEKNIIISSQFDINSPVTRYFKDTIKSLNVEGFKKTQAKRLYSELWEYAGIVDKNQLMLKKIMEIMNKSKDSKFIIFTRFVEKEAAKIGDALEYAGFIKSSYEVNNSKTYYIVTGDNAYELADFARTDTLPSVLILTYQIAEQGVNLPGFNYIINYHISAFPSALEQRYGRIDRMGSNGSKFDKIHNCFLIDEKRMDINTYNFYSAVRTYIYSLLSYIPSKNVLLSPEIINFYIKKAPLVNEYVEKIIELIHDDFVLDSVCNIFINHKNRDFTNELGEIVFEEQQINDDVKELLEFCDSNGIECDFGENNERDYKDIRTTLLNDLNTCIREIKNLFSSNTISVDKLELLLSKKDFWDHIFYCYEEYWECYTNKDFDFKNYIIDVDAVNECADFINQSDRYRNYRERFVKQVELPIIFEKYRRQLNLYFLNSFISNDFNSIFPYITGKTYADIFESHSYFESNDRELILENIDDMIMSLPFFEMCKYYKDALLRFCNTNEGGIRRRYASHINPLACAMGQLVKKNLELSEWFRKEYCDGYIRNESYTKFFSKFFKICYKDKVGIATSWLKLAYHCSRKEEFVWIEGNRRNIYHDYEKIKEKMIIMKKEYDIANNELLSGIGIYQPEMNNVVKEYKDYEIKKKNIEVEIRNINRRRCGFEYLTWTDNNNLRKWVDNFLYIPKVESVYTNDYWTKGILYELFLKKYEYNGTEYVGGNIWSVYD